MYEPFWAVDERAGLVGVGAQGDRVWFTAPAAPCIPHYVMSKGNYAL